MPLWEWFQTFLCHGWLLWERSFYRVVDGRNCFGCFWPHFPLLVLCKLRGTGRQARLVGVLRECRVLFLAGSCFLPCGKAKGSTGCWVLCKSLTAHFPWVSTRMGLLDAECPMSWCAHRLETSYKQTNDCVSTL
jgi:hypothetical protein